MYKDKKNVFLEEKVQLSERAICDLSSQWQSADDIWQIAVS